MINVKNKPQSQKVMTTVFRATNFLAVISAREKRSEEKIASRSNMHNYSQISIHLWNAQCRTRWREESNQYNKLAI